MLTDEPRNLLSGYLEDAVKPISYGDGWEEQKPLPKAMLGSWEVWTKISLLV